MVAAAAAALVAKAGHLLLFSFSNVRINLVCFVYLTFPETPSVMARVQLRLSAVSGLRHHGTLSALLPARPVHLRPHE